LKRLMEGGRERRERGEGGRKVSDQRVLAGADAGEVGLGRLELEAVHNRSPITREQSSKTRGSEGRLERKRCEGASSFFSRRAHSACPSFLPFPSPPKSIAAPAKPFKRYP